MEPLLRLFVTSNRLDASELNAAIEEAGGWEPNSSAAATSPQRGPISDLISAHGEAVVAGLVAARTLSVVVRGLVKLRMCRVTVEIDERSVSMQWDSNVRHVPGIANEINTLLTNAQALTAEGEELSIRMHVGALEAPEPEA